MKQAKVWPILWLMLGFAATLLAQDGTRQACEQTQLARDMETIIGKVETLTNLVRKLQLCRLPGVACISNVPLPPECDESVEVGKLHVEWSFDADVAPTVWVCQGKPASWRRLDDD